MSEHQPEESQETQPKRESKQDSLLNNFTPAQTFAVGAVGGFLVLCTIGFFILLFMTLGGDSTVSAKGVVRDGGIVADDGTQPSVPTSLTLADVDTKTDHILGNKNAKITLVEYSDLECPFCSRFHPTTKQVIDTYGDDVRLVFRHFPLTSLHPDATKLAEASECAGAQGKFWEFLDAVFEGTGGAAEETLRGYAKDVSINENKLIDCIDNGDFADKVAADAKDAVAAGGRGTPYTVLVGPNGEKEVISGAQPFTAIELVVKKYLN